MCLDRDWASVEGEKPDNPPNRVCGENLAYVIYTSGSTGQPKGVCVPHRAISRLVCNTDYVQLGPEDVVAQASNASFDAATFEVWGALLNGARLVGMRKETVLSARELKLEIGRHGVTTLFVTTALFNQLVRELPEVFGDLRQLLFGGEAVEVRWVREVLAKGGPQRLLHVYGPTEGTTYSTWHWVKEVGEGASTVPIGGPLANTEIYILDEAMNPVPVGVAGELYIGGEGLARGYLARPVLTAEQFVPHPFSRKEGGRLYRSGDLCRYGSEGRVEFLGRRDEQVKIRGFRIELGEIQEILNQHPAVKDSVVLGWEDRDGGKHLVSYVVWRSGATTIMSKLRRYLQEKLPDYMVPSALIGVSSIPLTPNGKVDRHALPAPEEGESEAAFP
jgi:amino acid adenylation domain-containing protein